MCLNQWQRKGERVESGIMSVSAAATHGVTLQPCDSRVGSVRPGRLLTTAETDLGIHACWCLKTVRLGPDLLSSMWQPDPRADLPPS